MRRLFFILIVQISLGAARLSAIDLDGDGMSDVWEQIYSVPSADANKDYDGTGLTNVQKSQLGLDPRNANSRFHLEIIRDTTQNQLRLRIDTAYGKLYQVENSTDRYTWSAVGPVITGTGSQIDVITTMPSPSLTLLFRHRFIGDTHLNGDLFTTWEKHQLGLNEQVLDTSGDGIPDWWKWEYGLNLFADDANLDPTGKGITVFQDYRDGTDPTNYYDGSLPLDEKLPAIQILSGNGQSAQPGTWLYEPLALNVTNYAGAPLQNAPIVFQVTQGGGVLSTTSGGATAASVTGYCDANGIARVYVQVGTTSGTNVITASAISGSQMTQVTFTATSDPAAPSAAVATPTYVPDGGYFPGQQTITIGCSTSGATIHYTTNGVDPAESDPILSPGSTIVLDRSFMLKSRAWESGLFPSHIKASPFIITGTVAAGYYHTLFLAPDGVLQASGNNDEGQLGNNSTTSSLVAVNVQFPPGSASPVTGVSAARGSASSHSLAVKADGTAWAWGFNYWGQLGNNSTTDSHVPAQVQFPSTTSGAIAVAAGNDHSLALKADGTVWAWGYNSYGQLGNNSITNSQVPVQVQFPSGNTSPVVSVAAGGNHSLAVKADGTAWAWGQNDYGQLGNNSTAYRTVPVPVQFPSGNSSPVVSVSGGWLHSAALKADGTLWAWGANDFGQLGNGSTTDSHVPVQVLFPSGNSSIVTNVSCGGSYVLAVRSDGSVWGWGRNDSAALAGSAGYYPAPREIPLPYAFRSGPVVAVVGGSDDSFAVKADGSVLAWGYNGVGDFGNGVASSDQFTPIQIRNMYDRDGDGLSAWFEIQIGLDPNNPDTTGLGLGDAVIAALLFRVGGNDFNNDGIPNSVEIQMGLSAFWADPTRWVMPPPNPNDHTSAVITITFPTSGITPL
jgi:alpha-tubulin suppressor-like RCC1 family protein